MAFRIQPLSIISTIALSSALSISGCSPEKKEEVSAATSGYMPADAKKNSSEKLGKSNANETDAGNLALPSASPPANTSPNGAQASSTGLPEAPKLPELEPGKIDPAVAGREFMKLAIPESK